MLWSLIAQVVKVILDVLSLHLITDPDKDLELLVLRQQIRVLERRVGKPVRPSRVEKLLLTLSALQIKERARAAYRTPNANTIAERTRRSVRIAS